MQTVYRLDEKDIISILAENFNVNKNEVKISCIPEIVNNGDFEKTEYKISCKIVQNN